MQTYLIKHFVQSSMLLISDNMPLPFSRSPYRVFCHFEKSDFILPYEFFIYIQASRIVFY